MNEIIQIHHISKLELYSELGRIVEDKLSSIQKQRANNKLSVFDVATQCGVIPLTVRNWIKKGLLKSHTLGRRVFILQGDLDEALIEVKSLKYQRS